VWSDGRGEGRVFHVVTSVPEVSRGSIPTTVRLRSLRRVYESPLPESQQIPADVQCSQSICLHKSLLRPSPVTRLTGGRGWAVISRRVIHTQRQVPVVSMGRVMLVCHSRLWLSGEWMDTLGVTQSRDSLIPVTVTEAGFVAENCRICITLDCHGQCRGFRCPRRVRVRVAESWTVS